LPDLGPNEQHVSYKCARTGLHENLVKTLNSSFLGQATDSTKEINLAAMSHFLC